MRWWSVIYRRVWDVIGIWFCADWIRLKNVKYAYVLWNKVKTAKNVFFCDFCIELQSIVKHCMQTVIFLQSVYYLYFIQIYNSFCLFFCFSVYRADHERYKAFLLARSPKIASLAYLIFFGFFAFYIVKNLTYEQPFIWTIIHMFSYNI